MSRRAWRLYFGAGDLLSFLVNGVLILMVAGAALGCLYAILDVIGVVGP